MACTDAATLTINELREFAGFSAAEQRYIRRSLDVALGRQEALRRWARDEAEAASIRAQHDVYHELADLRQAKPRGQALPEVSGYLGRLVRVTAFDLAQGRIESFSAYRFLYERLLGGNVRPWLPAAFCAASSLPQLPPHHRKILLRSISEAAATAPGWSDREPCFFPEWIEQEAA